MQQANFADATTAELDDAIVQLHAIETKVLALKLKAIAEYALRQAYTADYVASMTEWTRTKLAVSHHTAAEYVRVALALQDLPRLRDAFDATELTFEQVREATKAATPETDAVWADRARYASVTQLRRIAARTRPPTTEAAVAARLRRSLHWRFDRERMLRFHGRLPDVDGALFVNAIEALLEPAERDPETGMCEPIHARRADALVRMASVPPAEKPLADPPTVVVHTDVRMLSEWPTEDASASPRRLPDPPSCELELGPPVAVETARRLACAARWIAVTADPDGRPLGIGRRSQIVPRWLMSKILHYHGGCCFPGCVRTSRLIPHHIIHWARGGRTDFPNLLPLCPQHHFYVHEGGWNVTGRADGDYKFIRPDGRVFDPTPRKLSPEIRRRLFGPDGCDPRPPNPPSRE